MPFEQATQNKDSWFNVRESCSRPKDSAIKPKNQSLPTEVRQVEPTDLFLKPGAAARGKNEVLRVIDKQGMANKRKRNKFYAMVTDKETNIYTSWEECQAATKGKRNVKYKGFTEKEQAEAYIKRHKNKRVSVTPEKGKESNKTATKKTSSPTKEQAEAQINQEQSPVSAEDTIETSTVISMRRY